MQLEQHVGVEVGVDLVEVDRDLRTPQNGGVGTGSSVRAAERTVSSAKLSPRSGASPFARTLWRRARSFSNSAARASASTSSSIIARPSKASLQ